MQGLLLLLMLIALPLISSAQSDSKIDYDVFASFPKYNGAFEAYVAVHAFKPNHITFSGKCPLDILVGIGKTGHVQFVNILNGVSPEIDSTFKKAILDAPKWKPALLKRKPVNVSFKLHYDLEVDRQRKLYIINIDREIWPQGNANVNYSVNIANKVFYAVEHNPEFPGGGTAFDHFLKIHLRYPEEAKKRKVTGRVFIQFIVEKSGKLSGFKVLRDPGFGLAKEAIRILKKSPPWKPGMQNGKPIRASYTLPVNFSINQ